MTDYVLLRGTYPAAREDKRRWWLEAGRTLLLTADVEVLFLRQRQLGSASYALRFDVRRPTNFHQTYLLRPGDGLDLSHWAGVLLLPLATRLDGGRPAAALIEVVRTRAAAHWLHDGHSLRPPLASPVELS